MPEVAWFPEPPNPTIKLYKEEDWIWMNSEGNLGLRKIGASYLTFPLDFKRAYNYVVPEPSRWYKTKSWFRNKRTSLGYWIVHEKDSWDE